MYSVCIVKHILERGVIVLHVIEEPLLRELWRGQGLCVRLDGSLLEVVGVGLITCEEVGVVKRVHTLFGRNAQQVVYELQVREEVEGVRQEVREVKGEIKVERESSAACPEHLGSFDFMSMTFAAVI